VTIASSVAPGASVSATFKVTSPSITGAGFVTGKVDYGAHAETTTVRVRNALPIKINEVRFSAGANSTNQFIERICLSPTRAASK
jgi:hypothetical protein